MPSTTRTEAALMSWVNTFPLGRKVKALAELSDGVLLAAMLRDIDPAYGVDNLERLKSPSSWLSKKQSLEAVYKSLLRYERDCCSDTDLLSFESAIDFNAIAEHDDAEQIVKLLTIFFIAAIKGTDGPRYYEKLMSLEEEDQAEIAQVVRQLEAQADQAADSISPNHNSHRAVASPVLNKDLDLAFEEEHASLKKEHQDLKKRHADYLTRFDRLEQSFYDLQRHSEEADRELEAMRADPNSDTARYTETLQEKLRESNDLIATQERQLETDREIQERQRKELFGLKSSNKHVADLQDEVSMLRNENESLSKKANALDNYQKKLDRMSRIEGENETLRRRLDVLQENQADYDKVFQENATLQKTTDEYRVRFQTYEEDLLNLNLEKKHIETELHSCRARVQTLEDGKQHNERFIEDLQEQLRAGVQVPISPNTPGTAPGHMSLEDELEQTTGDIDYPLQISRLRAENQMLKATGGGNATALRASLDELEKKYRRLQQNHQDVTEQHAMLSYQMTALNTASMSEKDEAVLHTRKLYLEANEEIQKLKRQLVDKSTELSSRERELISAKADLSGVQEDEMKALEGLKNVHELITTSIETDIKQLQSRCVDLTHDSEQANKHLLEALLAKNKLQEELQLEKASKGQVSVGEAQTQESKILDLQQRLRVAEEAASAEAQKAKNDTLLQNLRRENALMTTAWYDLTSRLQSNHVVLQRRQEAPKSWLSRQRQQILSSGGRR